MASKRARLANWSNIATRPARKRTVLNIKKSVRNALPSCRMKLSSKYHLLEKIVAFACYRCRLIQHSENTNHVVEKNCVWDAFLRLSKRIIVASVRFAELQKPLRMGNVSKG